MDVIAIRRSAASPELLAMAMLTVAKSREQQQGQPLTSKATLIIPLGMKYPPLSSAERSRMTDAISRLLAAAPRAVPTVGNVPAISLELP